MPADAAGENVRRPGSMRAKTASRDETVVGCGRRWRGRQHRRRVDRCRGRQYVDADLLTINQRGGRIEIEMKERMLFGSGEARLSPDSLRVARAGAEPCRLPSHLQVEGHTDNVPIATAHSRPTGSCLRQRAASVVHFLAAPASNRGACPRFGLGEHRPIAENTDEKGRAANRRVTVVVLTGQREAKPVVDHEVPWAEGRRGATMRIWTVANQKGGVGKTTTTVALGGLLAAGGFAR